MGEPSIVERNARIIKWLIKCRNTPAASIPASGSTGQLKMSMQHPPPPPLLSTQQQQQTGVHRGQFHSLYYGQSTRL